jgi:hypothetical protein
MNSSSSSGPSSRGAASEPYHHGSHRDLLSSPARVQSAERGIDAIIVPTARRPAYLIEAAELALALGCALVTLHSGKWTSADRAAQRLPTGVDLIAVDVPEPSGLNLPAWETSRLLARTPFQGRSDLSAKRNLALMLASMAGWSHIMFLDDDITCLNPDDVRTASGLLGDHHAVGFRIGGFPDHSVVCHAYRDAGGSQQSFIGGGALAIDVGLSGSFFPDIYNDDWFFLLGDAGLRPTACTGEVVQYRYDPFRNPERARAEELGDVLAEGIYWLLDQGRLVADADAKHWARFLAKRRTFIQRVLGMVEKDDLEASERARRVAALKGSLGRLALITPELCESYLKAWMTDRRQWRRHIAQLPSRRSREEAIGMLSRRGAPHLTCRLRMPRDTAPEPAAQPPAVEAGPRSPRRLAIARAGTRQLDRV